MRPLFTTLLCAAIVILFAPPAHAGSVSFGFSSGHDYDRYDRYGHHRRPHRYGYYAPPRRPAIWRNSVITRTYYYPQPQYIYVPVIVATDAARDAGTGYCREYQAAATVGGLPQPAYGTACLQPDGSWKITN